jgi:hypothetical protein
MKIAKTRGKLTLTKRTLKNLKIRSGVKAGARSITCVGCTHG